MTETPDRAPVERFAPSVLFSAATMYHVDDLTQGVIATRLGVSRATVGRLLAEARRLGMVRTEVVPLPDQEHGDLADRLATALELGVVYLSAPRRGSSTAAWSDGNLVGSLLAPAVGRALSDAGLVPGDVLLVSSGRTIYEVSQFELPQLPGVLVAPTLGGTDEHEDWYQTNQIVRLLAQRVAGRATYLFAPALPGPELYASLIADPVIQRVLHLWPYARCVLTGIGAAPMLRPQLPLFLAPASGALVGAAGDVCSRFYDRAGEPMEFPGSDRLIAVEPSTLQTIPVVVGVAVGQEKVGAIVAGARARYFNRLVTDPATATAVLSVLERPGRTGSAGEAS